MKQVTDAISYDLISRAPNLGAMLVVTVDDCRINVSTILYAGKKFTRAQADECEPCFYEGDIDTYRAARNYLEGAPCAA